MKYTMKNNINQLLVVFAFAAIMFFGSCKQAGMESPGSEFMPDMAHSIAYEANSYSYYYNNTWGTEDEYYKMAQPREPVKGTVARGYAGGSGAASSDNGIHMTPNGSAPYYYGDTDLERERATAEIINNPYPITDARLSEGKDLYNIYCGICHGDKGDGGGYLVRDDGGKYPVQPANFLLDDFVNASNGRYYHSIVYGKNMMGSYVDKLSFEERWNVIHYIRSLQAKDKKLVYNQYENTLNSVEKPAGDIVVHEVKHDMDSEGHHHEDGHGHDNDAHGHSDSHDTHGESHDNHGDHGHDNDHEGHEHN